ncbi:MAG: hypothetical protein US02_C0005G0013 [Candidatus Levybacteria bacterium GW2011_GWA2_36_13]|nr:MAG: hypothetical protein US02_C0005G0013 [Candidatus Levybacteria bacterium GW2011_GWA2_36_13]
MQRIFYLTLLLIVILAGILRFYNLTGNPISLYWDEVSSTYNAYSILETGRDEFGKRLPLLFEAFEDYKTPANIYLTSIVVKFFGLSEFSARFTSAFFGTLTILVTYFLVLEILRNESVFLKNEKTKKIVALISSFLLAISPWHLQFSRTGFEANIGLFFLITGILFLLKFINSPNFRNTVISAVFLGVSIYFYRSIQLFLPLLLIGVLIIFRKNIFNKENFKFIILGSIVFLAITLPFVPTMLSKEGLTRQRQTNFISNSSNEVYKSSVKINELGKSTFSKVIFNRRVVYLEIFVRNYFSHFSPNFLFLNGDPNPRHSVKGMGVLYSWEFIFVILGSFALFKLNPKTRNTILYWILIAPIPAALAYPAPHALRSLNILPVPQFIIALGMIYLFIFLSVKWRKAFIVAFTLIIIVFMARYLYLYHNVFKFETSSEWADGYKQAVFKTMDLERDYQKIIVTGKYWQPYIYYLFYTKYSPKDYQLHGTKKGFGKYYFGGTSWDMKGIELWEVDLKKIANGKKTLLVLAPVDYELKKAEVKKITSIYNHNNELVFIIGELK